jgi:O-antigen/teichoic acid export membrane protein
MTDASVTAATPDTSSARRQIRGSSLLMAGRFLSLGLNFLVHILIVRYLSESDFGAFAYALSLVALGETVITLGLDRAVTRFIPIYDEQKDYARVLGTLVLVFGTVIALGVGLLLVFWALRGVVAGSLVTDQTALSLLMIMVFLSPIQALDTLFNGLFTVFSSPKAIFVRRYVMGPGMRLLVVSLLILSGSQVEFLAVGYLLSGVFIIVVFGLLLARILHSRRYFERLDLRNIRIPALTVLSFTVPLLASDLLHVVMNTVDVVLLEQFNGTVGVAEFRAVLPMARLNQVVLASFALLYTPAAARLFARNDKEGIKELYWQNAIWTAVVSFPMFAVTFSLAAPVTTTLLEERYADSALIMAILALGYYVDSAFGQSGLTLKVLGKVRYILGVYLTASVLNVAFNLVLIPPLGAVGAAVGTTLTLILLNIMQQVGLYFAAGINILGSRHLPVYLTIAVAAGLLLVVQATLAPPFIVSFVLAAVTSLAVLRINRRALRLEHTFPELLKIPGMRWFMAE